MKILVVSGTGFIGEHVLRALTGHDVWVFHRGHTIARVDRVQVIRGERGELRSHASAIRELRLDVVLDMTARNAADAEHVIEAVAGATRRIVMVSSGSVYRNFGVLLTTEPDPVASSPASELAPLRRKLYPYRGATPRPPDDPKHWLDDYDKLPAERAFVERADVPVAIVRLPMVYGPGDPDRRLDGYVRHARDRRPVLLHTDAASWRNSRSFVGNAAHAIARIVTDTVADGVFNVAEPADLSEAEWVERIGGVVHTVSRESNPDARPAIDELPVHANFAQHLRLDSGRIRRELGYTELVDPDEALNLTVAQVRGAA